MIERELFRVGFTWRQRRKKVSVKTKAVTGRLEKGVRWTRKMSEETSTVVVVQEEKSQGRRRRGRGRRMPRRRGRQERRTVVCRRSRRRGRGEGSLGRWGEGGRREERMWARE